jgi:hypothetical protein
MGPLTESGYAGSVPGLDDFDRYVDEHGIPEEHYPTAHALWYAGSAGEPVPSFEKVERAREHPQIEGDDLWLAAVLPNRTDST